MKYPRKFGYVWKKNRVPQVSKKKPKHLELSVKEKKTHLKTTWTGYKFTRFEISNKFEWIFKTQKFWALQSHSSLLKFFFFFEISTYNSYLPSIFGRNALWGHWGQRTVMVPFNIRKDIRLLKRDTIFWIFNYLQKSISIIFFNLFWQQGIVNFVSCLYITGA